MLAFFIFFIVIGFIFGLVIGNKSNILVTIALVIGALWLIVYGGFGQ